MKAVKEIYTPDTAAARATLLGELARVFEPGFRKENITTSSGRILKCYISPSKVSIVDRKNTDYHFKAYARDNNNGTRTFSYSVNTANTDNPDRAVADGKHPDIRPAALVRAAVTYFDALDPDNPIIDFEALWPAETMRGGPSRVRIYLF